MEAYDPKASLETKARRFVESFSIVELLVPALFDGPSAQRDGAAVSGLCLDLLAACRMAAEFIRNGIEFGYIRMPDKDTPDNANKTYPALMAAIARAEKP